MRSEVIETRSSLPERSRIEPFTEVASVSSALEDVCSASENFALRKVSYRVAFAHLASVALLFCLLLSGTRALAGQKQTAFPLAGTVEDALGRPVPGAIVTLQSGDGRTVTEATTNDHGQFRLSESVAGTYALVTHRKGFKPATKIVILPRSAGKHLEIVLESEEALTLPVNAGLVHPQNGLSQTGTNRYTLTAKDITNLPLTATPRRSTR